MTLTGKQLKWQAIEFPDAPIGKRYGWFVPADEPTKEVAKKHFGTLKMYSYDEVCALPGWHHFIPLEW